MIRPRIPASYNAHTHSTVHFPAMFPENPTAFHPAAGFRSGFRRSKTALCNIHHITPAHANQRCGQARVPIQFDRLFPVQANPVKAIAGPRHGYFRPASIIEAVFWILLQYPKHQTRIGWFRPGSRLLWQYPWLLYEYACPGGSTDQSWRRQLHPDVGRI